MDKTDKCVGTHAKGTCFACDTIRDESLKAAHIARDTTNRTNRAVSLANLAQARANRTFQAKPVKAVKTDKGRKVRILRRSDMPPISLGEGYIVLKREQAYKVREGFRNGPKPRVKVTSGKLDMSMIPASRAESKMSGFDRDDRLAQNREDYWIRHDMRLSGE